MKFAIISDIHSNLEALEVALSQIKKIGFDEIICLGDIIGYGPNPIECIDMIFSCTNKIIRGNHEESLLNVTYLFRMSEIAREAIIWTKKILPIFYIDKLKQLKKSIEMEDVLFCHSTPSEYDDWNYIRNQSDAKPYLDDLQQKICFIGHSHIPDTFWSEINPMIGKNTKRIINVGSVGQPRDKDARLSFGIFDTEICEYKNYRFEYNFKETEKKIILSGLPHFLGNRLSLGI
jgi:predicted phosphodiesterase